MGPADHRRRPGHPSGKRVEFEIGHGASGRRRADEDGTCRAATARCVSPAVQRWRLSTCAQRSRPGMGRADALSRPGQRRRVYLRRRRAQAAAAGRAPGRALRTRGFRRTRGRFSCAALRHDAWADLFTNRQLLALTTFSDLVIEARERVLRDALAAGAPRGDRLEPAAPTPRPTPTPSRRTWGSCVSRLTDYQSNLA